MWFIGEDSFPKTELEWTKFYIWEKPAKERVGFKIVISLSCFHKGCNWHTTEAWQWFLNHGLYLLHKLKSQVQEYSEISGASLSWAVHLLPGHSQLWLSNCNFRGFNFYLFHSIWYFAIPRLQVKPFTASPVCVVEIYNCVSSTYKWEKKKNLFYKVGQMSLYPKKKKSSNRITNSFTFKVMHSMYFILCLWFLLISVLWGRPPELM